LSTSAQISSFSSPPVSIYISKWPTSTFSSVPADNVYNYYSDTSTPPQYFEVSIKMVSQTAVRYLRYNSIWGKIQECANVISVSFDPSSVPSCT
jgi:hypothetical protein